MDENSPSNSVADIKSGFNGSSLSPTNITAGKLGNARSFNGSSDRISVTSPFAIPSTNGTLTFWVRPSTWPSTVVDMAGAGTGANDFRLYVRGTSALYGFYIGGEYRINGTSTDGIIPAAGSWTYFTLTWSSAGTRVYLNGVFKKEKTTAPPAFTPTGFSIGRFTEGYFNGIIDEMGVWNRALSAGEISSLYNGGAGFRPPISEPITSTPVPSAVSYNPKVLLLIYNPILEEQGNQKLTAYKGWSNPDTLTTNYINSLKTASASIVNYTIVERVEIDGIPVKNDGFQYTDDTYLSCVNSGGSNCHSPDQASYLAMINQVDACTKRNNGTIDELWIWGGPWFGYWESNLAGPNAFWYNSSPTTGTTCNKLLPIMGFNYERGVAEMMEDLGHRIESTMRVKVFGSWAADYGVTSATAQHDWDRFTILDNQSSGNGGCGNAHTAFNSTRVSGNYDRDNLNLARTSCKDFANYPNLTGATENLNCNAWGCTTLGYYRDWFYKYFPRAGGTTNGKLNNWWAYIVDPQGTIIEGSVEGVSTSLNLRERLIEALKQLLH